MLSISQVFILSPRGDKLIFKDYRRDIKQNTDEIFYRKYRFWDGGKGSNAHPTPAGHCPPVFLHDGVYYGYIARHDMLFVMTTIENTSPSTVIEALHRFARILKDFIGILNEESLKLNFSLVYEILDEYINFGFLQETATEKLLPYIMNTPVNPPAPDQNTLQYLRNVIPYNPFSEKKDAIDQQASVLVAKSQQKNELFIDLIERLNVVFNSKGNIQTIEIAGSVVLKSFLIGSPLVTLGLNEDITLVDDGESLQYDNKKITSFNLHECVNSEIFDTSSAFSFRPPLGEFFLMNYRIESLYSVPFRLFPTIEQMGSHHVHVSLVVQSDFSSNLMANDVRIQILLPKDVTTATAEPAKEGSSDESTEYSPSEKIVSWTIPKFPGKSEYRLLVRFSTNTSVSYTTLSEIGPISMTFEIPNLNLSALHVRSLRIQERTKSYSPTRWVRHITKGVNYVYRL